MTFLAENTEEEPADAQELKKYEWMKMNIERPAGKQYLS